MAHIHFVLLSMELCKIIGWTNGHAEGMYIETQTNQILRLGKNENGFG